MYTTAPHVDGEKAPAGRCGAQCPPFIQRGRAKRSQTDFPKALSGSGPGSPGGLSSGRWAVAGGFWGLKVWRFSAEFPSVLGRSDPTVALAPLPGALPRCVIVPKAAVRRLELGEALLQGSQNLLLELEGLHVHVLVLVLEVLLILVRLDRDLRRGAGPLSSWRTSRLSSSAFIETFGGAPVRGGAAGWRILSSSRWSPAPILSYSFLYFYFSQRRLESPTNALLYLFKTGPLPRAWGPGGASVGPGGF